MVTKLDPKLSCPKDLKLYKVITMDQIKAQELMFKTTKGEISGTLDNRGENPKKK